MAMAQIGSDSLKNVRRRLFDDEEDEESQRRYGKHINADTGYCSSTSSDDEIIDMHKEISALTASNDENEQITCLYRIQACLKREDAARDKVFQAGIVPRLVAFLKNDDNTTLQIYAARILKHLAGGATRQVRIIIQHQAIPQFVRLLKSSVHFLQNHALDTLGEIVCERPHYSTHVLSHSVMPPLLEILDKTEMSSTLRAAASCLSVLCQGELPNEKHVLSKLHSLLHDEDKDIVEYACNGVTYFIQGTTDAAKSARIQAVIEQDFCPDLVQLCTYSSEEGIYHALSAVCEIASGDSSHVQTLIDCSVLPKLLYIFRTGTPILRKKVCQIIVCISSTEEHIQSLIDATIFVPVIGILNSKETEPLHSATVAINNVTEVGTAVQIEALVQMGCVESLCYLVNIEADETIILALSSLVNILAMEEHEGKQNSADKLKKNPIAEMLKVMRSHNNWDIRQKAITMFDFLERSSNSKV